jgi:hypothetical protein
MVNISSVQHGHLAMATWPKDSGLNAVELTVTDAAGDGFKTWFGFDQALDNRDEADRRDRPPARLEQAMTRSATRITAAVPRAAAFPRDAPESQADVRGTYHDASSYLSCRRARTYWPVMPRGPSRQ